MVSLATGPPFRASTPWLAIPPCLAYFQIGWRWSVADALDDAATSPSSWSRWPSRDPGESISTPTIGWAVQRAVSDIEAAGLISKTNDVGEF